MNKQVSLGPLTRCLTPNAKWTDQYPPTQALAHECEQLLELAESHLVSEDYRPRLQASERQRDAALDELRVARFLTLNDFRPVRGSHLPSFWGSVDGKPVNLVTANPLIGEINHESEVRRASSAAASLAHTGVGETTLLDPIGWLGDHSNKGRNL